MIESKLDDLLWRYKTTAEKLAQDTGLSTNTISKLRNNISKNVSIKTLNTICKYFKCNLTDLIEYIPD